MDEADCGNRDEADWRNRDEAEIWRVEMDWARKTPARAQIFCLRAPSTPTRAGSERAVGCRRRGRTTEPRSSVPHRSTGQGRRLARRRCACLSAELGGFLKNGHHRDEKKMPVVRALKGARTSLDVNT